MNNPVDKGKDPFQVLAHPARWSIFDYLAKGHSTTATAIAPHVGLSPSATSYHMRELQHAGLIDAVKSKDGRERLWQVHPQELSLAETVGRPSMAAIERALGDARADIERLAAIARAPESGSPPSNRAAFAEVTGIRASPHEVLSIVSAFRRLLQTYGSLPDDDYEEASVTRRRFRLSLLIVPEGDEDE